MQELEKILEEIGDIYVDDVAGWGVECNLKERANLPCDNCYECIKEVCKNIIRKHMNDGWIPAKEKPSEDGFYVATMSGALVDQEEPFVGLAEFEDGEWVAGDDVIAWRPLPEPYHPDRERSEGE